MANFIPLKNYILYCIDMLIKQYQLAYPFLDIGCGKGDLSKHLASKNWQGKAIDISEMAIERAGKLLSSVPTVEVKKKSLLDETGVYKTIFAVDVLEHLEDDKAALNKISSLLQKRGHLLMVVPSNPKEWRWDDDFYGHYRRYTVDEMRKKLIDAGFEPIVFWDCTYPIFWFMRRIYTGLGLFRKKIEGDEFVRGTSSSLVNAWDLPFLSALLSQRFIFWNLVFKMQFAYFKDKVQNGHEMIVLAEKSA